MSLPKGAMRVLDMTYAALSKPPVQPKSNWTPLVKLVGEDLASDFMLMGNADSIILYKHRNTRKYLNVDAEGKTYRFVPAKSVAELLAKETEPHYEQIPSDEAIREALG